RCGRDARAPRVSALHLDPGSGCRRAGAVCPLAAAETQSAAVLTQMSWSWRRLAGSRAHPPLMLQSSSPLDVPLGSRLRKLGRAHLGAVRVSDDLGAGGARPRIALVSTHGYVAARPPLGAADTGG